MAATADNATTALALARAGLAVFPCQSGGPKAKQPMPFIKWREASTCAEHQILQWWKKWPDAAIGLDLAKCGLIVIDADRHDPDRDGVEAFGALMAVHGHDPDAAPLVATPSSGNHHFFRQPPGRQLGNGRGSLPPGVDVRGHGGYVIAPGTVMQDGRTYELFGDLSTAPELPEWLVTILEAKPAPVQPIVRTALPTGASETEDLLWHIPADCDYQTWLETLMALHAAGASVELADQWSATGGAKYSGSKEVAAKWRSFKRSGISIRTLAAIAERYGADLNEIYFKHNAPADDGYDTRQLLQHADGTLADAETGEIVEVALTSTPAVYTDYPPGLVGMIAQWITDTSLKPQPMLSLGAALTIVGTAAGRQFMGPVQGGSTVLYVLGLAPTGQGKDAPLTQVRRIFKAAGLSLHLGPDEFMSFSAVVNVMVRKPLCLAPMDEFGDFMRRIYDKLGGIHARAIPKLLRSAWGKNFNDLETAEWADKDSRTICAPHLSIFGCSTHEQFYSALEKGAVSDGTLNRFMIIEGETRPRRVKPDASPFIVPDAIVNGLKAIYFRSGELAVSYRNDPSTNPAEKGKLVKLTWCPDGAEAEFDRFSSEIEARMFAEPEKVDFMVRTVEMAVRIATIIAIGRLDDDQIRLSDLHLAIKLARQSLETMMTGATDYMAENEHHASSQKIVRLLKKRGGRAPYRDIVRCLHMPSKAAKDMLVGLCDAELIERQEVARLDGGGHPQIWYALR